MKFPDELYVVVSEHDGIKGSAPIVWETYINEQCTKEKAICQANLLRGRYGETRIARLVFEDDHLIERLKLQNKFELVMTHKVIIKTEESDYTNLYDAVEMIPTSRNQNVRIFDLDLVNIEIKQAEPLIDLTDAMTDEEIA